MSQDQRSEYEIIEEVVSDYIERRQMFTVDDIVNSIRSPKYRRCIRNRTVATWLRGNVSNLSMVIGIPYDTEKAAIQVGNDYSNLYLPTGGDPNAYTNRSQPPSPPTYDKVIDDANDPPCYARSSGGTARIPIDSPDDSTSAINSAWRNTHSVDRLGNAIGAGDKICYPVRHGSTMEMHDIEVSVIIIPATGDIKIKGRLVGSGRKVTIRKLENVTKLS